MPRLEAETVAAKETMQVVRIEFPEHDQRLRDVAGGGTKFVDGDQLPRLPAQLILECRDAPAVLGQPGERLVGVTKIAAVSVASRPADNSPAA
jgi:hypothetical protein